MKAYVIKGENGIGKTDFAVNLAEYLQKNGKVLLVQAKRNANSNIEDFFQKDGMITYDLADYFSSLATLDKIIVHETDNLDFIISPLLEDKYDLTREDLNKLLSEISYDYVILDEVNPDFLNEKTTVEIINQNQVNSTFTADTFFINKASDDYDIRNDKQAIDAKSARFLGTVKNGQYFKDVIENLINGNAVAIAKLGFFEKLKMSFRK
ncbi:P-loop NTPase family protein [Anaerococcus urinomassiliensis]|uniref:AAA family ATPase n=1 Tax=Anaerococcus urinomassiliensis TaxID=1745712 RepID=UPI00093D1AA6|nr:AAA family ATPase [Anaerococcus urinomassiliensis]